MSDVTASLSLMLKHLRLGSIKDQRQPFADKSVTEHWCPEQYLSELCVLELVSRKDKRLQRYLKKSTLPPGKQLGSFNFDAVIGVPPTLISQLTNQSDRVKRSDNPLLFGASSIGYGLIEARIRVKFVAAMAHVQSLQRAKEGLRLRDALARLDKYAMLIIDDLGYIRKTEQKSSVLFDLIAHRYERHSLIITSNQDFEH